MIFDWVLRASSASCLDLSLINCYMWRLANVVHVNFDGQHSIKTHVCSAMAGFPEYHSSQANESLGQNFVSAKFGRVLRLSFPASAIVIQQSKNYIKML